MTSQSFAHLCGDPETLTFRYLPPAFEQDMLHDDAEQKLDHQLDAEGLMNRRVNSFTRGIRVQLALRDTGAAIAENDGDPTDSQEAAALSTTLRSDVVHLVLSQMGASRNEVRMAPGGDASYAAATIRLKQADVLADGIECKSEKTTERHVSEHVNTLFALARHHVRVHSIDVRGGFLAEALATIELPEWAAWVLYTYFVGQRRRAAEAEAAAGGDGETTASSAPQWAGDELAAAVLPRGGVKGLGRFVTQDLTVGEVCACSLRAHAPQMAGSDIASDTVAMHSSCAAASSDSDEEERRPDFGGMTSGDITAKRKNSAGTVADFTFSRGPAVVGVTTEWNVRRKKSERSSDEDEIDDETQCATLEGNWNEVPLNDADRARAKLEAGVEVDKKNSRGKVQVRLLYLVGDTLWVGKSKNKATKSFPLSGVLLRKVAADDQAAQHWLRICRQHAAVGPKGQTRAASVSTMRVEVRGRGAAAHELLDLLSTVTEAFHVRMIARKPLRAVADDDSAKSLVTTVGSTVGASAPTFLEGMLERKSRWLKRWAERKFTLHGTDLSYKNGVGKHHRFEVLGISDVPQRRGMRQHRFNLTVRRAGSSADIVLALNAAQAREKQTWVDTLNGELSSVYRASDMEIIPYQQPCAAAGDVGTAAKVLERLQDTTVPGSVTQHITNQDSLAGGKYD